MGKGSHGETGGRNCSLFVHDSKSAEHGQALSRRGVRVGCLKPLFQGNAGSRGQMADQRILLGAQSTFYI